MLVPIRIPRTSKPPMGTMLDWSNPLTHGILLCSAFNEFAGPPLEQKNGKFIAPTYASGASSTWSSNGLQLINSGGNNATVDYIAVGSAKGLLVGEGTIFQVVKNLGATTTDQGVFQAGANHRRWILHQGTNASVYTLSIVLASGVTKVIAYNVPRGVVVSQAAVWRNGGENGSGYLNGQQGVSWTGAAVQTEVFTSVPLHGNCEHQLLLTYSRSLSAAEIASLSANPWQIFEPEIIWVELGGGLTSITGTADQVLTAILQSAAGSIAIAGSQTATLSAISQTASGTVAITGNQAAVLFAVTQLGSGSLLVSGNAAQLLAAFDQSASGSIAIVGTADQILNAITQVGIGVIGTPPITGSADQILGAIIQSASGTISITGSQATQLAEVLQSSHGAVLIQGNQDAVLEAIDQVATGHIQGLVLNISNIITLPKEQRIIGLAAEHRIITLPR